jgi:HAUS augmin-like complex subunit 2
MAKFPKSEYAMIDAGDGVTQAQANPWISDRSLGSVRTLLQLAESIGITCKDDDYLNDRSDKAYDCAPSLRMVALLRETRDCRCQLDKVSLEIQQHLQDRETQDITHVDVLEQRIAKINELNSHLEELIKNKQALISRLQQPFVTGYVPIELQYQRYAGDFLPRLIPTLSELSTHLENLEWLVRLGSTAGDLGGLLADVTATLATHQAVCDGVNRVRGAMKQIQDHQSS